MPTTAGRWRRDERPAVRGQRAAGGAHRGGHERLARPDPAQPDRVGGARAARAARTRCAASRRTRRSSRRRSSARTTTTTRSSSSPRRGCPRRRSTRASRSRTCSWRRTSCGRSGTRPAGTTASSRSRSRPTSRIDTDGRTLREARDFWERVDRPNLMIKIPGTDEGLDGDRGGDRRRHQHQRHAAVLGRGLRARRRGATSAGSSAGSRPASRSTCTRSRASSSRASTPRSTSGSSSRATPSSRAPRRSRTRARRTCASRRSSRATGSRSCARPAPGAAPAVGVDRRQEPALPGHEVRRRARRAAHRQHDADADAARRRRARRDHAARPPTRTRATSCAALADAGIDMDDVTDEAPARGHRRVRQVVRRR